MRWDDQDKPADPSAWIVTGAVSLIFVLGPLLAQLLLWMIGAS
jgi:hypothetical protein